MTGSLQIKNENYYAVLNFRDKSGKRVQKWFNLNMPVKGNKRRAEVALTELLVQYQGYEAIEPMMLLLSQHIAQWLEANRPNIAVTTYDQYCNILNNHIRPYFDPRGIILGHILGQERPPRLLLEKCVTVSKKRYNWPEDPYGS